MTEDDLEKQRQEYERCMNAISAVYIGEALKISVPLRPGVKVDISISGAKWNKKILLAFSRVIRNMAENFEEAEHPLAEFEKKS